MDHDRLFKELLSTFFVEFIDLFLPDLSAALDREAGITAINTETFVDFTSGDKHVVDVLMKCRFRGEEAFFLIYVENQATAQADFPKRLFRYFSRLTERYNLPVYPVVIFSYDAPLRSEPDHFIVSFPSKTVLRFDYTVIQLNRLPWRDFVHQENPVASALMAKMQMDVRERPKVKAQCLRLLASLKLDPARTTLIGRFIDSYLSLSAQEMQQYEREIAQFTPVERDATMEIMTSWERKGREEGLHEGIALGKTEGKAEGIAQGKETLVLRQLQRRFGVLSAAVAAHMNRLSPDQLDNLGEALLDFGSIAELEQWLVRQ